MKKALAIVAGVTLLMTSGFVQAQATGTPASVNPFQPPAQKTAAPPPLPNPTPVAPMGMAMGSMAMPMPPAGSTSVRRVGTINGIDITHTDQGYQFGSGMPPALQPHTP